ncbi:MULTISPECIES: tRNA (adenine(22)-N(1))-methyltransferase TrmK [unclassified Vibrio]|uniref:tRNA (adenine(22)-N(1))-methyltransferase n=1 Tax=unclassified Vibrio TaxID=2614977 RepID=UPI0010A659F2|nr:MULTISPECIES: tRNA (adenine(22)-N(1))-methyltransferase TrmK [unclassified Vibrio]WGY44932.1 tRNA (adenine(22)-N(1))-methyltransferase TrmK [Vibrio sp. ABG19]
MKLSKRLKRLESQVHHHYDHIWDCCCDHGLLGAALLERQAGGQIHFVDIVPDLMTSLQQRLTTYFGQEWPCQWQTYCMDVARIPVADMPGSHLVIIAGVGGDLMSDLIAAICSANPNTPLEFLLCPVHHTYTLREQLRHLKCHVIKETLVEDNQRFYEILHLTTHHQHGNQPLVSLTGDSLWRTECESSRQLAHRYQQKLLTHYGRMQQSNPQKVAPILTAYQSVEIA